MQSKKIIIGEKYLIGWSSCAKVLEAGVERANYYGSVRKDGVLVKLQDGYNKGRESIISSREVKQLWSEYQTAHDIRQLSEKISEMDRQRVCQQTDLLKTSLQERGIEVLSTFVNFPYQDDDHHCSVELSEQSIEQLIKLLSSPAIAERALTDNSQSSESLLSELLS